MDRQKILYGNYIQAIGDTISSTTKTKLAKVEKNIIINLGYYNPRHIYSYEKPKYVNVLSIKSIIETKEGGSGEIYSKT